MLVESPTHPDIGLHHNIVGADYRDLPFLNQSTLKKWIELGIETRCPAKFRDWYAQERTKVTDSMKLGSLVDTILLEPMSFDTLFCVVPKDAPSRPSSRSWNAKNPSDATAKAIEYWTEFEKSISRRMVVGHEMLETAKSIVSVLMKESDLMSIFRYCKKAVGIAELQGHLCKCEMDLYSDKTDWLFDLKVSCDASNTEFGFGSTLAKFGYDIQTAFYLDILKALGRHRNGMGFIVVESEPPHYVNVITLPDDDERVEAARVKYRKAIHTLQWHRAQDYWPSYTQWEEAITPRWHMKQAGVQNS